jgi:hypothetical protein
MVGLGMADGAWGWLWGEGSEGGYRGYGVRCEQTKIRVKGFGFVFHVVGIFFFKTFVLSIRNIHIFALHFRKN